MSWSEMRPGFRSDRFINLTGVKYGGMRVAIYSLALLGFASSVVHAPEYWGTCSACSAMSSSMASHSKCCKVHCSWFPDYLKPMGITLTLVKRLRNSLLQPWTRAMYIPPWRRRAALKLTEHWDSIFLWHLHNFAAGWSSTKQWNRRELKAMESVRWSQKLGRNLYRKAKESP
jgi:hypothetical protein